MTHSIFNRPLAQPGVRYLCWSLLGLLVASSSAIADRQKKTNDPAKIESLVKQLRAASFQSRMQAEADCRKTGAQIIPALLEAVKSNDPEMRRRAQLLIEQIEDDELSGSIESFLSPGSDATLPGWEVIAELTEDSQEIRMAYAEVLRGNTQLTRALNHPPLIGTELQRQLQNLGPHQGSVPRGISPAHAAAVLLLLVHPEADYSSDWGESAFRSIRPAITAQEVNETAMGRMLQALITRAVITPKAGMAQERLDAAIRLSLPEAIVPALEIVTQRNNQHQLNFAFVAIARFGGAAEMSTVESLLTDTFELNSGQGADSQKTSTTQVRDLALATLIAMTEQDPTEYGLRPFPRDQSRNVTALNNVAFPSDQERDAAFEKWKVWSAAHLRKYRPIPANAEEGVGL